VVIMIGMQFWREMPKALLLWPNRITLVRILIIPLLFWLAIEEHRIAFGILYAIVICTDWIDGIVARRMRQETPFGARFDSVADLLFYWCAAVWVLLLVPEIVSYWLPITITGLIYLIAEAYSLWQLGHIIDFHSYLSKIAALGVNGFVLYLSFVRFVPLVLYFCLILLVLAAIENILLTIAVAKGRDSAKSIFLLRRNP